MLKTLFLHSWGSSRHDWDRIAGRFPDGEFPDLRGFGDAPAPEGSYSVSSYADDLARMVEGWDDYAIVGHSMGGKYALAFAMRQPAGLRQLVLVAPSPPTPEPMSEEDRQESLKSQGDQDAAEKTVEKVSKLPIPEPFRSQAVDDYVRTSKRAWDDWLLEGSKEDISADMDRIEMPVHVVVGTADPVMHPEMLQREVVARLKDCTFETVEGSGHLLPLEAPEALTAILKRLL